MTPELAKLLVEAERWNRAYYWQGVRWPQPESPK